MLPAREALIDSLGYLVRRVFRTEGKFAMNHDPSVYDEAASRLVELGNRLAEADEEADLNEIADGLLAGAVHFWLYSRQPCDDPRCEDCAPLRTPEWRLSELQRAVDEMARTSDYFHSPDDMTAGSA